MRPAEGPLNAEKRQSGERSLRLFPTTSRESAKADQKESPVVRRSSAAAVGIHAAALDTIRSASYGVFKDCQVDGVSFQTGQRSEDNG